MPRVNKSGVQGLFRRVRLLHPDTGAKLAKAEAAALAKAGRNPVRSERWVIDLQWLRIDESGRMVPERYFETLPDGTKAEAARKRAREILDATTRGTFKPDAPAPVKLHSALDVYLTWAKVNRPKSNRARESIARALRAHLTDLPLDELAPWHVEKYKAARREAVGPATVNREVAMLKHLAGLAAAGTLEGVRMDRLAAASVRAVKMLREPPGRVRSLTPNEERRLLAAMDDDLRPIVLVADATGMRRGEVARLRAHQVDLDAAEIVLTVTKSNKPRRVPISDTIAPVLAAAVERVNVERRARPDAPGYLFPSRRGRPYSLDAISRAFSRAVDAAGIEDLRFHDLRHDAATKMRRSGHGLDVIAKVLGHADVSTSARYAHVEPALVRAAVADVRPMALPTAAELAEARAKQAAGRKAKRAAGRKAKRRSESGPIPVPGDGKAENAA